MAVKIRLQRHGKKGKPFYWIVAADSRSKRDGKYLEKIGTYDPNQKPAAIDLNFDSALSWLNKGAQPTSTAKTILSYTGVLLKRHLDGGVKKGAFTEAEAKKRFDAWMKEKSAKIEKKIEDVNAALESNKKEAREREEEYRKKKLEESKAKEQAKADEAPADEAPADEAPADEAPADEAPADEAPADEAPADEAPADEAPADEAPADEAPADEAPADEAPADEAPADDAPADEAPADEAPADEAPADEAPADEDK
jgi:small subunit ribosomal protein S16